jgi:hypothetical protein
MGRMTLLFTGNLPMAGIIKNGNLPLSVGLMDIGVYNKKQLGRY